MSLSSNSKVECMQSTNKTIHLLPCCIVHFASQDPSKISEEEKKYTTTTKEQVSDVLVKDRHAILFRSQVSSYKETASNNATVVKNHTKMQNQNHFVVKDKIKTFDAHHGIVVQDAPMASTPVLRLQLATKCGLHGLHPKKLRQQLPVTFLEVVNTVFLPTAATSVGRGLLVPKFNEHDLSTSNVGQNRGTCVHLRNREVAVSDQNVSANCVAVSQMSLQKGKSAGENNNNNNNNNSKKSNTRMNKDGLLNQSTKVHNIEVASWVSMMPLEQLSFDQSSNQQDSKVTSFEHHIFTGTANVDGILAPCAFENNMNMDRFKILNQSTKVHKIEKKSQTSVIPLNTLTYNLGSEQQNSNGTSFDYYYGGTFIGTDENVQATHSITHDKIQSNIDDRCSEVLNRIFLVQRIECTSYPRIVSVEPEQHDLSLWEKVIGGVLLFTLKIQSSREIHDTIKFLTFLSMSCLLLGMLLLGSCFQVQDGDTTMEEEAFNLSTLMMMYCCSMIHVFYGIFYMYSMAMGIVLNVLCCQSHKRCFKEDSENEEERSSGGIEEGRFKVNNRNDMQNDDGDVVATLCSNSKEHLYKAATLLSKKKHQYSRQEKKSGMGVVTVVIMMLLSWLPLGLAQVQKGMYIQKTSGKCIDEGGGWS